MSLHVLIFAPVSSNDGMKLRWFINKTQRRNLHRVASILFHASFEKPRGLWMKWGCVVLLIKVDLGAGLLASHTEPRTLCCHFTFM